MGQDIVKSLKKRFLIVKRSIILMCNCSFYLDDIITAKVCPEYRGR